MRVVFLSRMLLGTALIFSLAGCVAPQPEELIVPTLDPLPTESVTTRETSAPLSTPAKKAKPEKKTVAISTAATASTVPAASPARKIKPEKKAASLSAQISVTVQPAAAAPPPKLVIKPNPASKVVPAPAIAPRIQPPTIQPVPAPQSAPDVSMPPSTADETDTGSGFDNLEFVDARLKAKLNILRVGSEPSPNNLLTVFAGVKNKTSHHLDLEIQTIYKDKAGNELNHGSWIPVTLKPHEEKEYRSSALSTDASDFVVRIRNASDQGAH